MTEQPVSDEMRDRVAEVLCRRDHSRRYLMGYVPPCRKCSHLADALLPLLAEAEARGRADAERVHRDLTSRLGFGDNVTEPQADNDTIVRWFEEQSRDANEWQESQLWRNDCYVAGHPDDEDCAEHDPLLLAEARGVERERAEVRERVEALTEDLWRVAPCGCGHRADLHADAGCTGGLALCKCNRSFPSLVTERIRAALTEKQP